MNVWNNKAIKGKHKENRENILKMLGIVTGEQLIQQKYTIACGFVVFIRVCLSCSLSFAQPLAWCLVYNGYSKKKLMNGQVFHNPEFSTIFLDCSQIFIPQVIAIKFNPIDYIFKMRYFSITNTNVYAKKFRT